MKHQVLLHPSGPSFSRLILGAWRWRDGNMDLKSLGTLLDAALESGIDTLDHADIYGNYECESFYGEFLKTRPDLREKFKIVTKCGIKMMSDKFPDRFLGTYDTGKEHIVGSAESSLQKMGIDQIDLLLIHRSNPLMDPDEVAEAFVHLRDSGKVRHLGVSNFIPQQFDLLQSRLDFPLVTNQVEISLTHNIHLFDGTLDHLHEHRIRPMAWSPLGGGSVFQNQDLVSSLQPLAEKYGTDIGALLIAWLLKLPSGLLPVLGTARPDRLITCARAADFELERQDWFLMLKLARGYDVP